MLTRSHKILQLGCQRLWPQEPQGLPPANCGPRGFVGFQTFAANGDFLGFCRNQPRILLEFGVAGVWDYFGDLETFVQTLNVPRQRTAVRSNCSAQRLSLGAASARLQCSWIGVHR